MQRSEEFYIGRSAKILSHIQYATLAKVTDDGQPWNSPVRALFDTQLNCYWFSDKEGQHSRNVRSNGAVFIVVYDSTVPEGAGAGVYFRANVIEMFDREDIRKARRLKHAELNDSPDLFLGGAVRRVYKAVPSQVWTNEVQWDGENFVRDYRVELSQPALRRALTRLK